MTSASRRSLLAAAALWLAVVVVPPVALWRARGPWLDSLDRPEAQAAWDEFRRDMAGQTGKDGPVQRKVPRSPEPPLRVWLRDYFALAVGAWVSFAGVAGCLVFVLLWGSLSGPGSAGARGTTADDRMPLRSDDGPRGHGPHRPG